MATQKMSLFGLLIITLTTLAGRAADPHYAMTVVSKASVMNPGRQTEPAAPTMACTTTQSISPAVALMGWKETPTGEKVTQINSEVALYITRNGDDDGNVYTVIVWMEVKKGKKLKYYALTDYIDVDLDRSRIPQIKLENGMLVVEAYTKSYNPSTPVLERKVPDYYGQTYQSIRLGSLTDKGLELQTMNCSR